MTSSSRSSAGSSVLVGTSGFSYDHWDDRFYPQDLPERERLSFYAQHFRALELNVTFYRMPSAATFRRWGTMVPEGFRFAVKASRYLTHVRRLRAPKSAIESLMERATQLDARLGPVLLQLPPDFEIDLERLDETLDAFGEGTEVSVEFRHPSWFTDECRRMLARHRAALCLVDRRGPRAPRWKTASWTYLRLHEGTAHPRSCYGQTALRSWADRLTEIAGPRIQGYVFFNNDAQGCAVENARTLERMLARSAR